MEDVFEHSVTLNHVKLLAVNKSKTGSWKFILEILD